MQTQTSTNVVIGAFLVFWFEIPIHPSTHTHTNKTVSCWDRKWTVCPFRQKPRRELQETLTTLFLKKTQKETKAGAREWSEQRLLTGWKKRGESGVNSGRRRGATEPGGAAEWRIKLQSLCVKGSVYQWWHWCGQNRAGFQRSAITNTAAHSPTQKRAK